MSMKRSTWNDINIWVKDSRRFTPHPHPPDTTSEMEIDEGTKKQQKKLLRKFLVQTKKLKQKL